MAARDEFTVGGFKVRIANTIRGTEVIPDTNDARQQQFVGLSIENALNTLSVVKNQHIQFSRKQDSNGTIIIQGSQAIAIIKKGALLPRQVSYEDVKEAMGSLAEKMPDPASFAEEMEAYEQRVALYKKAESDRARANTVKTMAPLVDAAVQTMKEQGITIPDEAALREALVDSLGQGLKDVQATLGGFSRR